MGLFDINFNLKVIELLPPDKRFAINVRWLQSLIAPIQYLRDKILGDYKTGSSYSQWSAGTYAKYAKVVYKSIVYESLIDGNTDAPPSANWALYLPSYIGVDQRVLFNGVKLTLEYALNTRFLGTFKQPPNTSDIYITNLPSVVAGFLVGQSEAYTSKVGQTTTSATIGYDYPFLQVHNFQINIPTALYSQTNDSEISDFVRKFIPASLTFTIANY